MAAAKLRSVKVSLKFPFTDAGLEGTWEADEHDQAAAWEMYVEMITRVGVVGLKHDGGMLREALSSIHSLFATTRDIMRRHGPTIARPKKKESLTFAQIAIMVLNDALRPMLAKWHPTLLDYEETRHEGSRVEHERKWALNDDLRGDLEKLRTVLTAYSDLLAAVAGVPSLADGTDGGASTGA